ncbi:MAG: hypothetical protein NTY18_05935, partial [Deltaproteobacteria bacterium]|nr:hypothetical protein [Deltaproteobacteria bacterium]
DMMSHWQKLSRSEATIGPANRTRKPTSQGEMKRYPEIASLLEIRPDMRGVRATRSLELIRRSPLDA